MTLNGNWSRASGESRTEEYRTWRTQLRVGAVTDVDQIEYRGRDGEPLLIVELCVADRQSEACPAGVPSGQAPSPGFFREVERKVAADRAQGRCLSRLMARLEVPVLLVVYIKGELDAGVWVRRLDLYSATFYSATWQAMPLAEYARRLQLLHERANP